MNYPISWSRNLQSLLQRTQVNSTDISLQPEAFFDLVDFEHRTLLDVIYVWDALAGIKSYTLDWLSKLEMPPGVKVPGVFLDESKPIFISEDVKIEPGAYIAGPTFIGEGTKIESGSHISGPTIIGRGCVIRQGAYIRGNVITGDNVVIGHATEVKGSILLNHAHAAHFNYIGDSIIGVRVNLGAGSKTANMPMTSVKNPHTGQRSAIKIQIYGRTYDTGLGKLGAILGDRVQAGCNSIFHPGSIVGYHSYVYPNVGVRKGYIGPYLIVKESFVTSPYSSRADEVLIEWIENNNVSKKSLQDGSFNPAVLPGAETIIPTKFCDELDIPQHSTGADAVKALLVR